jgi:ADP-ribosylglycohydrolase
MNRDRIRAMFMGIAIGDALGVPVEIYSADQILREFGRITTYVQNPTHKWSARKAAGSWSDDTQLTLAVAESLIVCGGIDMDHMVRSHLTLIDEFGDMGLGATTREALDRCRSGIHWSESGKTDKPNRGGGNALPMKVAPIGAWLASQRKPQDWKHNTSQWYDLHTPLRDLTCMTHRTHVALESAMAHVWTISHIIGGISEENLQPQRFLNITAGAAANAGDYDLPATGNSLTTRFLDLARRNLEVMTQKEIAQLNANKPFQVINSLLLAYACFLRNPHSIEAMHEAVAAGGDTDTNASIVGGMLGALNGMSVFPDHLITGLWMRERIQDTAERFCDRFGIKE